MTTNQNSVELIGFYGGDLEIALSAWTSTSRDISDEKRARIGKMIKQLWTSGHETPAEKGIVHFLVNTEIATHIQICKHRLSSLNAESARYKELKEDKFYIPNDWADIKQSDDEYPELQCTWRERLQQYTELGNKLYHECLEDLTPILGRKRAKESARFFKTYNSQITADVMFNMRSFANFLRLRDSEHAQLEIREIAHKMYELVRDIPNSPFQHTIEIITRKNKVLQKIHDMPLEEVETLLKLCNQST